MEQTMILPHRSPGRVGHRSPGDVHLLVVAGIMAVAVDARTLAVLLLLAIPSLAFEVLPAHEAARLGGELLFFTAVTAFVVRRVLQSGKVSLERYLAAACGYLLLGLTWGLGYFALFAMSPKTSASPDRWGLQSRA